MSLVNDLKVLYHLTMSPIRGKTHAERLESFYSGQAEHYDDFRRRLLKGRREMYRSVPVKPGAVWVDMGGGTGSNLEYIQDRVPALGSVHVVDLSASLLAVARKRFAERGWNHVHAVEADVTVYTPPEPADVVTFSYSLTMIPNWFAAIDQALRILKPGGHIGVVDFYVSRKHPMEGARRHGPLTRAFWPNWFAMDNVFPSPDHLPYLHERFDPVRFSEHWSTVPYTLGLRTPFYRFIGKKPS